MPNAGVPVIVAVRGDGPGACAVNTSDAGFRSGERGGGIESTASVAVAVIVGIGVPCAPFAIAGAVIDGRLWHPPQMVSTVVVLAVALVVPVPSLTVNTML